MQILFPSKAGTLASLYIVVAGTLASLYIVVD